MTLRFEGYAALFDRVDRAGDVMRAGAFAQSRPVPLLWQHRGAPVGAVEALAEDAQGLRIAGRVDDAEVARLVRARAIAGLSVGYRPTVVRQAAWREVLSVDLVEISLVAVPMQPGAGITDFLVEE